MRSLLWQKPAENMCPDDSVETTHGAVSIAAMHPAKGLEFRAVVVLACDDDSSRILECCDCLTS